MIGRAEVPCLSGPSPRPNSTLQVERTIVVIPSHTNMSTAEQ